MMLVVVVGSSGQLGSDLVEACRERGIAVRGLTHAEIEVCSPASVTDTLGALGPQVVINTAAAHGAGQDTADDQSAFFQVNALGAWNLARWCRQHGAVLVQYSTDYVFGMQTPGRPYTEDDRPCPVNVYGASKLAGEELVRAYCARHYIVRVASLFGRVGCRAKGRSNFVKMVLDKAHRGEHLAVVDDQVMSPTWTWSIAAKTIDLLEADAGFGLYHMAGSGSCSWYDLACEIVRIAGAPVAVQPVHTPAESAAASFLRPRYTALDNLKLRQVGLDDLPPWRVAVYNYMRTEEDR